MQAKRRSSFCTRSYFEDKAVLAVALTMQVLSLTDYISKTRTYPMCIYPTYKATGIRMAKGACMCGRVAFEFSGEPVKTVLCHCLNCKRITGTAYSTNVTVLTSTLRTYGSPKQFTFDSGQGPIFRIFFCDNCSSTLWKESDADGFKGLTLIQSGTLGMEFDNYPPNGEIFTPFRSKWLAPLLVQQFEGTDSGL